MFSYYHKVSCVKLPHELAFAVHLPVSQPPFSCQDVKQI